MSFEGFYQRICASGHFYTRDVYSDEAGCDCGAPDIAENLVNETNFCGGSPCQCGERAVIRAGDRCLAFGEILSHPH